PYKNKYIKDAGDAYPGGNWAYFNGGNASDFTSIPMNYPIKPNSDCINGSDDYHYASNNWAIAFGFKSNHPGGANFVFCDGSIHFLNETINMKTYNQLGCRNDGRTPGEY